MSKYQKRGAYHYSEFKQDTPYRHHVLDLIYRIQMVLPSGSAILDVGAGEGLILSQLKTNGFKTVGCDLDPHAVTLAEERNNDVRHGTIKDFAEESFDAILLCDVLEHVKDFKGTLELAKKMAPLVVVAIPDRSDMHAERMPTIFEIMKEFKGWELVHSDTRHVRHLMIFRNNKP